MIVYWSGCLLSMLIAWLCGAKQKGREQKRAEVFFAALPLVLISALRYDVGEDYLNTYVAYFQTVQRGGSYAHLEPLYHLLNAAVAVLGGDYVWVFVATALMFMLTVYAQIFEDSPYPALSIFLLVGMGYYFVSFNAMRQMVGCGILLYSLRYIQNKRILPFLLCVASASCFHISCVVFIVMYWLGRIRIKPIWMLMGIGAVTALSPAVTQFIRWIIAQTSYGVYLSSVFDTGQTAYVMMAINALLLVVLALLYDEQDKTYQMYFNLQGAALLITVFSGRIVLFLRMLWMFGLPSVISLPMAVAKLEKKKTRGMLIAAIVLMYFLYAMYTVGIQNSNHVLPYQTILGRWIG